MPAHDEAVTWWVVEATKGDECEQYVCHSRDDAESVGVTGQSMGGRFIGKDRGFAMIDTRWLTNFRAGWIPEHLRERIAVPNFPTREQAEACIPRLEAAAARATRR